jgi:hypothetical protein
MAQVQQTLAFGDIQQHCCPVPSWLQHQLIRLIMAHAQQALTFVDIQQHCCTHSSIMAAALAH